MGMERVRVESVGRIIVELDGIPIAETTRGFVVHERGLDDRYYLPRDDVRAVLSDGTGTGTCPWKGKWKHLDVTAAGRRVANGAWTYHEVTESCEPIRDFIAFYNDKFRVVR
jgi:uncharacterized protein (DUF427 family)